MQVQPRFKVSGYWRFATKALKRILLKTFFSGADGAVFIWRVPEEFQIMAIKQEKAMKKSITDIHLKQPEQIREIGSRRSSRNSSIVANCPPVDSKKQPSIHPKMDANMLDNASVCGSTRSYSRK